MDWASAGPGGQHDWHARGELGESGHGTGGHMAGAEGGHDQAVHMLADRVDEHAVLAQRDGHQADANIPRGKRR